MRAVNDEESTSFWDGQLVASPWLFMRPFVLKADSKAASELRLGLLTLPWQPERTLAFFLFLIGFSLPFPFVLFIDYQFTTSFYQACGLHFVLDTE